LETGFKEISDGVFMITLPMPFRLEHVNIYAFINEGRVSLIDTGPNLPGVFAALEKSLAGMGRKISDIERILITHFHGDHCGLAGAVHNISGAAVHMRQIEYNRLNTESRAVLERLQSFYREEGLPEGVFGRFSGVLRMFREATLPFKTEKFLVPGAVEDLGGMKLEVISTPGHTVGQVVFFCRERGLLFSGDHVLPHITPNLSPDIVNPWFRPLRSFIESLDAIRGLPVSMVYPAHGRPFPGLDRRIEEIKAHHEERKGLIMDSVNTGPKSAYEVSQDLFGADLSEFDKFLALNETYVHLEQLEIDQAVQRKPSGGVDFFSVNKKRAGKNPARH
jgi:glyoxylase-like metal-dependent hydrolase (beta-lactamase superfamily II)